VILPVVLALAVAPAVPTTAFAAEPTSGYKQTPTPPKSGTSPSQSTKTPTTTPAKTVAPATTTTQPAKASASTLPFTGLDLRWTVGAGLVLIGAGGSIMVMQRRQRRDTGR
jgi:hypothetical protein